MVEDKVSTDSDIVDPEDIPEPVPQMKPVVMKSQLQDILAKVLGDLQEKALSELTIPLDQVREHRAGGTISQIANQFSCVICNNFIVPMFKIGLEGIDVNSLQIPECRRCERVACYHHWEKHLLSDNPKCPNCGDVYEIPAAQKEAAKKERFPNIDEHM